MNTKKEGIGIGTISLTEANFSHEINLAVGIDIHINNQLLSSFTSSMREAKAREIHEVRVSLGNESRFFTLDEFAKLLGFPSTHKKERD